jgi:hypothetical protein
MLGWFFLLGCGLLAAGIYKALGETNDKKEKLERIQREIARREALEEQENLKKQENKET